MTLNLYNKQNPFYACIKERYSLSKMGAKKNTQHIVIDIRGSGLTYEVGDSVGIFSQHDPEILFKTLNAIKATGNEMVKDKQTGEDLRLMDCLTSKYSVTDITPKFLQEVYHRQTQPDKKHALAQLLDETNREALKAFLGYHEIWDLLEFHYEVNFELQEFVDLLKPLLPRFYSIASSQKYVGEEIHLTIAPLEYETNGHKRRGVCTHFVCELAELQAPIVPIFIQPTHNFRLPQDHHTDLIMIGPGTGVAPFRAFLQERLLFAKSKGKHWLFFGEKQRDFDFYYENDWNSYSEHGHLRLELAFSRDQEHKIYVQHRMLEKGQELYEWLIGGAFLYVCGDAARMAKDVEATLQQILQEYGKMDAVTSREYIKKMRQDKRYLRDVY